MPNGLVYAFYPLFLLTIGVELWLSRRNRRPIYAWKESLASVGVAVGHRVTLSLFMVIPTQLLFLAWEHRLFTVPMDRGWSIPLLFIGIEFFYYWYHRASHSVRWLWATHAVHHSANHFNLSAAYRLGWTNWLSGNIFFFMPLSALGFHPIAIGIGLSLSLVYQFWIHTELISKLGPLEWILNTPAHHRVHHASNPEYLDRNYGGVLIVFDRLFGTFVEARPSHVLKYGLTHPLTSMNPVKIAFYEWHRLVKDLVSARTWSDRCRVILGPPT
jgi:sterol desaturase/sphingolipid hydroxylase (fatty acid hydroxylase superfamily)